MINEDDYFSLMYSIQNEYRDVITASMALVKELCRGCKWASCPNMDYCKPTNDLRRALNLLGEDISFKEE